MAMWLRAVTALLPLALTALLIYVAIGGRLDLGGGEKDLVWIFPPLLWSLLFAASALVCWHRGMPLGRSLVRSALVGMAGVVLAAALLALVGQLGVAGRF
jgi:hypothetical protein